MILADLGGQAPVHPHADAHREHEQIQHGIGMAGEEIHHRPLQPAQTVGHPQYQGGDGKQHHHGASSFSLWRLRTRNRSVSR